MWDEAKERQRHQWHMLGKSGERIYHTVYNQVNCSSPRERAFKKKKKAKHLENKRTKPETNVTSHFNYTQIEKKKSLNPNTKKR